MQECFKVGGISYVTMPQDDLLALEHENQELSKALRWALIQLKEIDHDCHASPDSGCSWCYQFWQYGALIGMEQPERCDDEQDE